VRYLLDTHVLIWWLQDNRQLYASIREIIANPASVIYVSVVSTWEIVVKRSLGRLAFPVQEIDEQLAINAFTSLPIRNEHALALDKIPMIHRDPFDRLLIAQALEESMWLLTQDERVLEYPSVEPAP
jgi:PIN domain nuclease of toxin-antitoxin system